MAVSIVYALYDFDIASSVCCFIGVGVHVYMLAPLWSAHRLSEFHVLLPTGFDHACRR